MMRRSSCLLSWGRIYVSECRASDISSCKVYVLLTKNSSSPPRTLGGCLRIPLSSAIIMIIIVSRGLIELVRAKGNKVLASQSLKLALLLTERGVSK